MVFALFVLVYVVALAFMGHLWTALYIAVFLWGWHMANLRESKKIVARTAYEPLSRVELRVMIREELRELFKENPIYDPQI